MKFSPEITEAIAKREHIMRNGVMSDAARITRQAFASHIADAVSFGDKELADHLRRIVRHVVQEIKQAA